MTFNHLWINFKFSLRKVDGFHSPFHRYLSLIIKGFRQFCTNPQPLLRFLRKLSISSLTDDTPGTQLL